MKTLTPCHGLFRSLLAILLSATLLLTASVAMAASTPGTSSASKAPKTKTTVKVGAPQFEYNRLKGITILHQATLNNCTPGQIVQSYSIQTTTGSKSTVSASGSVTVSTEVTAGLDVGFAEASSSSGVSGTLTAGGSYSEDNTTTETVTTAATIPECTSQDLKVTQPVWEYKFTVEVTTTTTTYKRVFTPQNCSNKGIIHICRHYSWVPTTSVSVTTVTAEGTSYKAYQVDLTFLGKCGECSPDTSDKDEMMAVFGQESLGESTGAVTTLEMNQCVWCGVLPMVDNHVTIGVAPGEGLVATYLDVIGYAAPGTVVAITFVGTELEALTRYVRADGDGVFSAKGEVLTRGSYAVELAATGEIEGYEIY